MLADDLFALIALDALRARIPARDVTERIEHEDRVIGYGVDQQRQMLLGLLEPRRAGRELTRAHRRARFEDRVDLLQLGFGLGASGELALARLIKPRIVDGDRGLRGDGEHQPLGEGRELVGFRMAEEQAAEYIARARHDRHGEIRPDGQMALRHALERRVMPVARIGENVAAAHRPRAAESRLEDRGVARHRKIGESRARRARQRIERIGFALVVGHVVEERAELGLADLDAGIGHGLNETLEIEIGGDGDADAMQHLQAARFLGELGNAGFKNRFFSSPFFFGLCHRSWSVNVAFPCDVPAKK